MKKIIFYFLFLLFFIQDIAAVLVIQGETDCVSNNEYSYTVAGADLSSTISWSVTNGQIIGSALGLKVKVKWDQGQTSGKITVTAKPIEFPYNSTVSKDISIFNDPVVTNMNITASGGLATYSYSKFSLTYSSNNDNYEKTITWSINNAGSIKTLTGNNITIAFDKIGQTTITATLKYSKSSKSYITTKIINISDGSLATPTLTGISGTRKVGVGGTGIYSVSSDYFGPHLKEVWKVNNLVVPTHAGLQYNFTSPGSYRISCQYTNTKTGKSGNVVNMAVSVISGGGIQSLEIDNDPFEIIKYDNSILLSKKEYSDNNVTIKNNETVNYKIYNSLTGAFILNGVNVTGNVIDISNLSRGIYIIILNTDNGKNQSYKFNVK